MSIQAVQIHTMPNAPEGANGVYLYNNGTAQGLTLGQLMIAICARTSAILEAQSIPKMNQIGKEEETMKEVSEMVDAIVNRLPTGTSLEDRIIRADYWSVAKPRLLELNPTQAFPADLQSFETRAEALKAIKKTLEKLSQQSQENMIDLRSLINRRDVALTTATNLIRTLGVSINNTASNIK